jgi:hypothetical protein
MQKMLKGLPIAESELYKRRHTLLGRLSGTSPRRAFTLPHHIRKPNINNNQSRSPYETFTAPVASQETRQRVLPLSKSKMAENSPLTELA